MAEIPRVGAVSPAEAFAARDRLNRQWLDQLYDGAANRRAI